MNAYAANEPFRSRFEEHVAAFEAEIRHAVSYVDTVVVPEVRRESAGVLRVLATQLNRLADHIDAAHQPFHSPVNTPASPQVGFDPNFHSQGQGL